MGLDHIGDHLVVLGGWVQVGRSKANARCCGSTGVHPVYRDQRRAEKAAYGERLGGNLKRANPLPYGRNYSRGIAIG